SLIFHSTISAVKSNVNPEFVVDIMRNIAAKIKHLVAVWTYRSLLVVVVTRCIHPGSVGSTRQRYAVILGEAGMEHEVTPVCICLKQADWAVAFPCSRVPIGFLKII